MTDRTGALARRAIDVAIAAPLAILTSPLLMAGLGLAAWSTKSRGVFRQTRIGRAGAPFNVVKLRTMIPTPNLNTNFTAANDPRITRIGGLLRRAKVDELPQLWQVVIGEMALIGPRPDVREVIDTIPSGERDIVLSMRPGVSGPATIFFRDEESILTGVEDPQAASLGPILQCKTAINLAYLHHSTWRDDLKLIAMTARGSGWKDVVPMITQWDPVILDRECFMTVSEMRGAL